MANRHPDSMECMASSPPRIDLPEISVPNPIPRHWAPVFTIETTAGDIHVVAYPERFYCKGEAAAFIEHGLLRPEWFPGVGLNNKVMQRVWFSSGGPRLLRANAYIKDGSGIVCITKYTKRLFNVHIPPAKYQAEVIGALIDRAADEWEKIEAQRADERQKIEAQRKKEEDLAYWTSRTAQDIRHDLLGFVSLNYRLTESVMESTLSLSAYDLEPGAARQLQHHYAEIMKIVETSPQLLVRKLPESIGGNVVRFPRKS